MKKAIAFLAALLLTQNAFSQPNINVKSLVDALGRNARVYFLSANRPSFEVSAYTIGKDNIQVYSGVSAAEGYTEIPLALTYGISDNAELFANISPYLQSYDFEGSKISGLGDAGLGARFKFHESRYFSHTFETAVKIPTASRTKELGTGRVDLHFGLGHAYSADIWGYEAGIEFNLLHRRDLPGTGPRVPEIFRNVIDSLKQAYDYKFEPEIGFSISPVFYPTFTFFIYTGFAFSRNTRLDYNSSSIYAGTGYAFSTLFSLSGGASYGLNEGGSWSGTIGLNFFIQRKMY